jgi:Ran GTPase-activating protein (RanGAP) involved in mRNA processing and transport
MLTTLILEGNNIRAEGARYIAEALKKNKCLFKLHIGANNIRRDGAKAVADCLKVNTALIDLSLKANSIKGILKNYEHSLT